MTVLPPFDSPTGAFEFPPRPFVLIASNLFSDYAPSRLLTSKTLSPFSHIRPLSTSYKVVAISHLPSALAHFLSTRSPRCVPSISSSDPSTSSVVEDGARSTDLFRIPFARARFALSLVHQTLQPSPSPTQLFSTLHSLSLFTFIVFLPPCYKIYSAAPARHPFPTFTLLFSSALRLA